MREKSRWLAELYEKYRNHLDVLPFEGRAIPYNWFELPNPLEGRWMAYEWKLVEYSREIANAINALSDRTHRLKAWNATISDLTDDQKFEAAFEFLDDTGAVALGLPYAIKSRFAFAAAHLCHEANPANGFSQSDYELQDDERLYLNSVDPVCKRWKKFRKLKLSIEPIAGKPFNEATGDFRNAYNHRFPRRLVFGHTLRVTTKRDSKGNDSVSFGEERPLELDDLCKVLSVECAHCYRAFDAFQLLVNEQAEAIRTQRPA